ncbi:helix-turn-helix domain-containing protein [Roseovarius sp. MMSF_3281]|uniref:helix-turn-helix domain-containing protein n=1 Tax=Roseovarius sp. MMSF_3281 TaxID=3046694 RepID=UPI0027402B6A|nr:helix-turn-helix domain-containing protein [Roseovarius sp. MMSF_3281]
MYHENLETDRPAIPGPSLAKRSLAGEFVFISQDASLGFAAEACIDVLRSANRLIGREAYGWRHLRSEEVLDGQDGPLCGPDQVLVLVGGMERAWRPGEARLKALRAAMRSAARVCVVGAAVFVPLTAGVLGPKRLAVHPNFRPGVEELGRGLELEDAATCHHKALSSAISPVAALRMIVELVGARDGAFTRAALSKYIGISEPDCGTDAGEHWRYKRMAQGDPVIVDALQIMLDHLEDTLTVGQIADLLGVSPRKLERGFRDLLKQSPLKVYRDMRLERAHRLLEQTPMPLGEIAVACGFSNVTLMKTWFHRKYGAPPEAVRRHAFAGGCAA